jgi:small subunit ribosomal protein S20
MPITKSAAKRMQTSEVKRVANRTVRSKLASALKAFRQAGADGDAAKIQTTMNAYFSVTDKAAKKGVIKRNNGDRRKSRAMLFVARMAKAHHASTTASTTL